MTCYVILDVNKLTISRICQLLEQATHAVEETSKPIVLFACLFTVCSHVSLLALKLPFLPRDASAERGYEIVCPSVRPSVRDV